MTLKKKVFLWSTLGAALYFLLSYHFIFDGLHVTMLKKSRRDLNYTFYSIQGKDPRKILAIDVLREDGIADILIDKGILTEQRAQRLLAHYEDHEEDEY